MLRTELVGKFIYTFVSGTHCVVTLTILRICAKVRTFCVELNMFKISRDLLNIEGGY